MKTAGNGSSGGIALVAALCLLATLGEGIDLQAAGMAANGIRQALVSNASALGTFFSANTVGLFLGSMLGAALSDHLGRRRLIVYSVCLFGAFSTLNGFAWDLPSLVVTRCLTGFGIGAALPNLMTLVAESSPPARRNVYIALVYIGMPLGGALVGLISLALTAVQWRWIFFIGGIFPLALAPIMARYLPESPQFLAVRGPKEIRTGSATDFLDLFRAGRTLVTVCLWVSYFLGLLTIFLLLNWLPLLLVDDGLTARAAAVAQIGFNVGGVMATLLLARLLAGPWRLLSVGLTFVLLPVLLYALAHSSKELALIASLVFVLGGAVLAAQSVLYAVAPTCYPTRIRGLGVGMGITMGRVGSIVGPKLGGYWKGKGLSSSLLLMKLLPVVIVAGVFTIALALLASMKWTSQASGEG